jgi:molybdopterin-guanine dinucleotide biosynthesis protein A
MLRVLGAAIAGGRSTRYGSPKAFATVGGIPLIERVLAALRATSDEQIIVANDQAAYAHLGVPVVGDVLAQGAALAGIHAALLVARQRTHDGAFAVACDMPFPSAELLGALAERAAMTGADVVAPESEGPRGIEPLFAYYSVRCVAPIERAVERSDLRVIAFHDEIVVERIPLADVARFGDPATLFMNVNTPAERVRAEALVETRS